MWENGYHEPSISQMLKIAKITGYPLPEELTGVAIRPVAPADEGNELAEVRRVKLRLNAGTANYSIDLDDGAAAPIYFRRDWLRSRQLKAEKLISISVTGASMEPGLFDGDTVVINTADIEPLDGEVFAVNFEGMPVIKRLVRDAGQWWLASDNLDQRRYQRKACDEHSVIIGRVIHKQSERI